MGRSCGGGRGGQTFDFLFSGFTAALGQRGFMDRLWGGRSGRGGRFSEFSRRFFLPVFLRRGGVPYYFGPAAGRNAGGQAQGDIAVWTKNILSGIVLIKDESGGAGRAGEGGGWHMDAAWGKLRGPGGRV